MKFLPVVICWMLLSCKQPFIWVFGEKTYNFQELPITVKIGQCVNLTAKSYFSTITQISNEVEITWKKDTHQISNKKAWLYVDYTTTEDGAYYQSVIYNRKSNIREMTDFWVNVVDCQANEKESKSTAKKCTSSCKEVCPQGWAFLESSYGEKCFKYFPEPKTWPAAQDACQNIGSQLAKIESLQENNFIGALLQTGEGGWIGLNDRSSESNFIWNFDKQSTPKYLSWATTEPNNYNAKCNIENCVLMSKQTGKWSDVICNAFYPFVCEVPWRNDAFVGCFGISLGVSLLNKSPRIVYKLAGNIPLFSSMFISIGSLCLLTADRLIAIKKPLLYGSSFYRRSIKRGIAAVWAISLLISLQQSLIWVYVSSNMELKIRSIFLSVFFCAGAIVLFVSNVVLFAGIKNYISRVEQRTKSVFGNITISAAMASQTENQVKFSAVVPDRKNSALKINENEEPGSSKTRQPNVPCAENRLSLNSTTDVLPRIIAKADFKRRVRLTRKRELRRTSMLYTAWTCAAAKCYRFFAQQLTWHDALTFCKSFGGSLSKIHSSSENQIVNSAMNGDSWIGLNDIAEAGNFVWNEVRYSAQTLQFVNWASNEPNDMVFSDQFSRTGCPGEDCVLINTWQAKAHWYDMDCSVKKPYICERVRDRLLSSGAIASIVIGCMIAVAVVTGIVNSKMRKRSRAQIKATLVAAYEQEYFTEQTSSESTKTLRRHTYRNVVKHF
eukprot:gene17277-19004_t